MSGDDKREDEVEKSPPSGVENTRREFLGATAGAGIASKLWGFSGDDPANAQGNAADERDPAAVEAQLSEENGVFNIRDFGAVGDGETDDTQAIYDAIETAAEVQGTVLIPIGDFVTDWIILRHEYSGITIQGLGYGSHLLPLQSVDPEAAWTWGVYNDDDGEISINPTNFTRGIVFNDSFSPPEPFPGSLGNDSIDFAYRDRSPITDIDIRNLRLDGKREELPKDNTDETWEQPRYENGAPHIPPISSGDAPTGTGVAMVDHGAPDSRRNTVHNVWTHSWMGTGVGVGQGGVNINNVMAWDNGIHGVAGDSPADSPYGAANITNIIAFHNGGTGLDHGGDSTLSNFSSYNNGAGMKYAGDSDRASVTNGRLVGNIHVGFHLTPPGATEMWMDNIEARDNGGRGFRFVHGGHFNLGKITSVNNNQRTEETQLSDSPRGPQEVLVRDNVTVTADQIHVRNSATKGVTVNGGELHVNNLRVNGCAEEGVVHNDGEFVARGGVINQNGGSGIVLKGGLRSTITNARIGDDVGVDVQDGVGPVILKNLDLRACSTPMQIADSIEPTIEDVTGYVTEASGRATFDSGDYDKTYTVEHGLSTAPERVDVTPDASSDATQIVGVKNLSKETFEFEFRNVPRGGGNDDENVAVFWDASAY